MSTKSEQNRSYYLKHKAAIRARHARNFQLAKVQSQVRVRNRKARKAGAEGSFSYSEWLEVKAIQKNLCACCLKEKPLTIDHIQPVSVGGSNRISNIQALCQSCNSIKQKRTIRFQSVS